LKKVFVALDGMTAEEVKVFLTRYSDDIFCIKIGLELYLKEGRPFIKEIKDSFGKDIFLDLKLHDIPVTVAKSIASLSGLDLKFLTIHLSGGVQMLEAAAVAAKEHLPGCTLLGVSYLTSLGKNELHDIYNIDIDQMKTPMTKMALMAKQSGIGGMVLSAKELNHISDIKLVKVCPGIRLSSEIEKGQCQDQKRVVDPNTAFKDGADFLVMGRSITQSKNPEAVFKELDL
jgi:orotidine-5'-phosphate decarboxylase